MITLEDVKALLPKGAGVVKSQFNYVLYTKKQTRYFSTLEAMYYYLKGAKLVGFVLP